jgi:hypothetical protein
LGFGFQAGVVQRVGEGDEALEIIGTAFPAFAGAAEPGAVRAEVVGINFLGVAGETIAL